ncbi:hypothetical protein NDU88_006405 [Pleurodeles waltl]|uniref:Uncharacterized protein n=1 Tax=Pleurodeles waltl TaxID=8319 RepID=A0AAV7NTD0_PLEWA|nr:hypothetical protein NDU88_006405 [Pleurodeles waltl]
MGSPGPAVLASESGLQGCRLRSALRLRIPSVFGFFLPVCTPLLFCSSTRRLLQNAPPDPSSFGRVEPPLLRLLLPTAGIQWEGFPLGLLPFCQGRRQHKL